MLALQQHSCTVGHLSCIQTVIGLLSHIYALLHNALGNGTVLRSSIVSETLVGVTEALRIINTVSEYLGNIDTSGPRCARGVNAVVGAVAV